MKVRITINLASTPQPKTGLLGFLLLLTACFGFFECVFASHQSDFYLSDFHLIAAHLGLPWRALPGIMAYLGVLIGVHIVFTLAVWAIARLSAIPLRLDWRRTQSLGFWLWGLGLITVLLANANYYPNSKFADLISMIMPHVLLTPLFLIAYYLCVVAVLGSITGLVLCIPKSLYRLSGALLSITLLLLWGTSQIQPTINDASTATQPNIIFIGVDALRPDAISFFEKRRNTPHLDAFLEKSTVFAKASTPIARTYPAWISILSGLYPIHSGVRFDLAEQTHLSSANNLPHVLQSLKYRTIFATDETRFSNINKRMGFDQLITPPTGLNDFLIGTLNDFPLTNLLVNTSLGAKLLPYSYANRPAIITYNPNSFLHLLEKGIPNQRQHPWFLAVHLCLTHYPYIWGEYSGASTKNPFQHYLRSVHRADKQIQDLLLLLQQKGLLQHSIVVLLSDHGEALELNGDRVTEAQNYVAGANNPKHRIPHFYPPSYDNEKVNQSTGHGTDVLSETQYHSVLAIRTFGTTPNHAGIINAPVSLMDIKPTVLALLGYRDTQSDGHSLQADIVKGRAKQTAPEDFFIESDFSPQSLHAIHPETRKLLFDGIEYYQVDPKSMQMTVKPEMGELVIKSKQHADFYGDWILATYPQPKNKSISILYNQKTHLWTNDLNTPFARLAPIQHMEQAMQRFYGKENTQSS